ncbi:MAG: DoxX family protein [Chloroflexota bacterium]
MLQWVLALFFAVASGAPKLLLPFESLPLPIPLPAAFVRVIGIAEVAGAIGLIAPPLVGRHLNLVPLAALGLAAVAFCGAIYQILAQEYGNAVFALATAAVAGFTGYGRWRLSPHRVRIT